MTRSRSGKGAARAERRAGRVPGVIYGDGKPPLNVSVEHSDLKQRIYAGRFLTTVYELDIDGGKQRVIPRDFQLDPVKDLPIHVDFLRLGEGAEIRVRIPVHVVNAVQPTRPRRPSVDGATGERAFPSSTRASSATTRTSCSGFRSSCPRPCASASATPTTSCKPW